VLMKITCETVILSVAKNLRPALGDSSLRSE